MPTTYSPLRYPGGKTKLYSTIQPLILQSIATECIYVEPFAGGAGLALKLLFCHDVDELILNDIDENIYLFWHECLYNTEPLCQRVYDTTPSIEEWERQRKIFQQAGSYSSLDRAYATLFLNRCNVSGVISGGPIGGKAQNGKYTISARYNRDGLVRKIQAIGAVANRIRLYCMDAQAFLTNVCPSLPIDRTILNIDPPYVNKGPLLYRNSFTDEDHIRLGEVIMGLHLKWIVTYDKCDLIQRIYKDYIRNTIFLKYSAGTPKDGQELLITNL